MTTPNPEAPASPVTITRLEAENFLRLRAVSIEPGPFVEVAGRNAQGKSSVLRVIEATAGGKGSVPEEAVHDGADSGWTRLTLSNGLVVERSYDKSGGTRLSVKDGEGRKIGSAQTELDALLGALSFEPLAFRDSKPAEQRKTLAQLVGLDLDAVEAERKAVFDARTVQGREVRRLEGVLQSLPPLTPDLPEATTDLAEMLGVLGAARQTAAANQREREALTADEHRRAEVRAQIEALTAEADALTERIDAQADLVADLMDPDLASLERQASELDGRNSLIRANQERAAAEAALEAEAAEQKRLTAELARIDAETAAAVAAADLPVPGLAFDDSGITLNGQPFEQASAAETIRVCFAIAAAQKPALNVALIRDGSLLDDESKALIVSTASALGCQLWLERVGAAGPGGFVIEDGEATQVGPAPAAPAATWWE